MNYKDFDFNKEEYFGYTFYVAKNLEFAFDSKKNILLIFEAQNDYLNGVIYFNNTEDNKIHLTFKPRGSFNFDVVEKDIYVYSPFFEV